MQTEYEYINGFYEKTTYMNEIKLKLYELILSGL
jgi:hypothetical protein